MKKTLLAAVFLGATFFTEAFAQFTGGSAGREAIAGGSTIKKTTDKGVFDNAFYLRIARSSPKGAFGDAPTMTRSVEDSFNGRDGIGAQTGFGLEMGLITYLHEIPLQEQFKVGIDASLSMSANKLDWSTMDENYNNSETVPFIFMGFKIGPAFSYNPIDKVIIDVYGKLNPSISSGPDIYYSDYTNTNNSYSYTLYNDNGVAFAVRKSLGFNVRYSALMLGLEYNFGKVGYTLYESYSGSTNGVSIPSNSRIFEVKTPTSMLLWSLGVKF